MPLDREVEDRAFDWPRREEVDSESQAYGRRRGLCILTGESNPRTEAICRTSDGFALAEEDLKIRGSGELLGTRQSGFGELRALDPVEDLDLLLRAREAVKGEPVKEKR